jgi:hypothetical protein
VTCKWILTAQTASYRLNANVSSHQARLHRVYHQYFNSIKKCISRHEKSREKKLTTCSAAVAKIESLVFEKVPDRKKLVNYHHLHCSQGSYKYHNSSSKVK